MIPSQSLLAILASFLTLTCFSLIKSTLYPNLVIFTSETYVLFVIFFLFLQPQLLQIHLSPANLTIAIHYTQQYHKQISTYFNAFKKHWHMTLQTLQNINTSHPWTHKKTTLGFQSNKELSITNSVLSHINLNIYKSTTNNTYLYNGLPFPSYCVSIWSLIHSFLPFHISVHPIAFHIQFWILYIFFNDNNISIF